MFRPTHRAIPFILILFLATVTALAADTGNDPFPDYFKNLTWRQIGPTTFGGRIPDIEAVSSNPDIVYAAGSTGGIFKSENQGVTWTPIFDQAGPTLSIGDMALAPSDPEIIWVGTGEANCDQNAGTIGNGVYKSLDAGKTWQHMGLDNTHHIGRVLIDPHNPDVVYVAAAGHLWDANPERGVFRTRDGGKTWQKVLFIDEDTGVTDLSMEPNGRIIYAAAFQRRRTAWGIADGGPHSGIYRSLDGGDTWTRLEKGLPQGNLEKIGVAVAPSQPGTVYAIVGHPQGGVFRSDDRGDTWTRVNPLRSPGYWYGQIVVDPHNPDKVWVPGMMLSVSIDGGKHFESDWTARDIHVDHHALWIDPNNPTHQYLGNDGGFYVSWDNGHNWDFRNNLPIAQYYTIGLDTRDPYWIYGGLQDNGTWSIPSATTSPRGIVNADTSCVAYGDGFYAAVDPTDPDTVYAESQYGVLQRVNLRPRELKLIQPVPAKADEKYRFTWNSPLLISPHDPKRLYFGGNKLFTTTDGGQNWQEASPDLTRNLDLKDRKIMGVKPSLRTFSSITAISESPLQAGLIYVGTDDGCVQMTADGGRHWDNLTDRLGLTEKAYITSVMASAHDRQVAWVTFSGHYEGDYAPHVFKTDDGGKTWQSISATMPDKTVVNCIVDDPVNPDLLFAGVHNGVLISIDGGRSWHRPGGNLPMVAVSALAVEPREHDLVLATYGRGIIILDDITFLEQMTPKTLAEDIVLAPPLTATAYIPFSPVPEAGGQVFSGPNPEYGALITYWLRTDPPTDSPESKTETGDKNPNGTAMAKKEKPATVKLQILDENNRVIRTLDGPADQGFHRLNWDLRLKHPLAGKGGRRHYEGPLALPGTYTVKLMARNRELSAPLTVRLDPRSTATRQDLVARLEASRAAMEIQRAAFDAQQTFQRAEAELKRVQKLVSEAGKVPETVRTLIKENQKELKDIRDKYTAGRRGMGGLLWQLQSSNAAPNQSDRRRIQQAEQQTTEQIKALNALLSGKFLELHDALYKHHIVANVFKAVAPPKLDR